MTAYILRRLLATIPVMVVVAVFVFFLLRLAPGDPAAIIAGEDATADQIAAVHHKLGLDRPIFEQFVVWIAGMLQGDFGTSIFSNLPVSRLILQRLEPTVSLTLSTLLVAVCLAIPLGVLAAWKARRLVDRLVMGFAVMGFAMPVFLVGYVLIYVFAVKLGWLPVQGYRPIAEGLWPWAECLILPSLALGITYMALIARITRASMLDVLAHSFNPRKQLSDYSVSGFVQSRPYATERVVAMHDFIIMVIWSVHAAGTSASSYQSFLHQTFGNLSPLLWLLKGNIQQKIMGPLEKKLSGLGCEIHKSTRGPTEGTF